MREKEPLSPSLEQQSLKSRVSGPINGPCLSLSKDHHGSPSADDHYKGGCGVAGAAGAFGNEGREEGEGRREARSTQYRGFPDGLDKKHDTRCKSGQQPCSPSWPADGEGGHIVSRNLAIAPLRLLYGRSARLNERGVEDGAWVSRVHNQTRNDGIGGGGQVGRGRSRSSWSGKSFELDRADADTQRSPTHSFTKNPHSESPRCF